MYGFFMKLINIYFFLVIYLSNIFLSNIYMCQNIESNMPIIYKILKSVLLKRISN